MYECVVCVCVYTHVQCYVLRWLIECMDCALHIWVCGSSGCSAQVTCWWYTGKSSRPGDRTSLINYWTWKGCSRHLGCTCVEFMSRRHLSRWLHEIFSAISLRCYTQKVFMVKSGEMINCWTFWRGCCESLPSPQATWFVSARENIPSILSPGLGTVITALPSPRCFYSGHPLYSPVWFFLFCPIGCKLWTQAPVRAMKTSWQEGKLFICSFLIGRHKAGHSSEIPQSHQSPRGQVAPVNQLRGS